MEYDKHFYLGYFTRSRGLKGELQLFFEYAAYDQLDLSVLFVEIDAKLVPYFVKDYQLMSNNTGFFFLEDIDHINTAEGLIRKKVYLSEDKMPAPEAETVTLTGFTVVDVHLGELGVISEIHTYPQQEVAALTYKGKPVMFPLVDDFMLEINLKEKQVKVALPEGLLDVYL